MQNLNCWRMALCAVSVALAGRAFGLGAPTDLAAAAIDFTQTSCAIDCSAQLSWAAPSDGSPTGYRIYRRRAAHEHPTRVGTVDAATTSFTDTTATVGLPYLYTVTAVDADGESAESSPVSYRKLKLLSRTDCGTWTATGAGVDTPNKFVIGSLYDGDVTKGTRSNGWATFVDTFLVPVVISEIRVHRPADYWGTRQAAYNVKGVPADGSADVCFLQAASAQSEPNVTTTGASTWETYPTHADWADTPFSAVHLASKESDYAFFNEVEYYGYQPSAVADAGVAAIPSLGDREALLVWTNDVTAASYTVYRKTGEGAWTTLAAGLTDCFYKDTDLTDGVTYTYRVARVAANGDEFSAEAGVTLTAQGKAPVLPLAYNLAAAAIDFTQADCDIDCSAQLSWSLVTATNYDRVRVYRFIKDHEDETPEPLATLDKATTTYTDSSATAGRDYLYRVACFDSATGAEGPLSLALDYRKVSNVARQDVNGTWAKTAGEPLTSAWGNWKTWSNLSDGVAGKGSGIRIEGNGTLTFTWTASARPKLVAVRAMSANMNGQKAFVFKGTIVRTGGSTTVAFDGGSTVVDFPVGEWTPRTIASAYGDDVWGSLTLASSSGAWQYPCFSEVEAYGYIPGDTTGFLAAPELSNPVAGRKAVSLSWTAAANAASYTVYRKIEGGDWVVALKGVTAAAASDTGVTFDGTTYAYRVAAVAANGDELSSETKTVVCPAGAPFWWNFLNVKCLAFPGAAGYANPANAKPHFLSRDRAGTLLAVPMSTDDGAQPAVTFDLAALASADSLGELSRAEAGLAAYDPSAFGGGLPCWKGAAVSDDLLVIGNGAAGSQVAVVARATGACGKYALLDESGASLSFALDGGLDFNAAGDALYTNDGAVGNRIVKWTVDASAKTLQKVAAYAADGFTRIRNLTVCTIGGAEYALFGEGSAGTGRIGALKLDDGTVTTLVTDAENLGGDIVNVKLAAADGETYVVAQLDTAAVAVYALDADTLAATLEATIDAETMKALCGTVGATQFRNFEMTANGRYAFFMSDAGAATRLMVVGASERIIPEAGPALTATSDYSNAFTPTLGWTEPEDVQAESVRIFRRQAGKAGARALADVPVGTRTYVDATAVGGITYAYSAAYVRTVNGRTLVGARGAEAEALALLDLKTKRKAIMTSDTRGVGTLGNLFDDNTMTLHSYSQWGESAAMQFTERVQLLKARYMPVNWGTIHRGDKLKVSGNVEKETDWESGSTLVGTGPVVSAETWYDVTLNGHAATADGWDYLVLSSGYSSQPYLNLYEVDFYGATVAAREAAEAKTSEAGRDDAPTAAAADCSAHTLVWTEDGTLVGVRILRSRTPDGPFVEVGRVAPGVGTFADQTAVDGVVYYYRLAYLTEFEGVIYASALSAPIADYGARLEKGCRAATLQNWTYNWSGVYGFDENTGTVVNGPWDARFGLAFTEPVLVHAVALRGPEWAVNDNGYRIDSLGIYAAPAGIAGIADTTADNIKEITETAISRFTQIGTTPSGCHTAQAWYVTPVTGDAAWSYLHCYRSQWYASISGLRVYGYPQRSVAAAKAAVVWPVENLAVTMSGRTAKLAWSHANARATSVRIDRQVNGGDWTTLATLGGTATSYDDETVAIGAHSAYRVWTADAAESVYAAITVTPLLTAGDRAFVKRCSVASDPLFVDACAYPADLDFRATYTLAGTTAAALGVSGEVRLVAAEGTEDGGDSIQIVRDVSSGSLRLYLKGPGHASGTSVAAEGAVPESDALRLERVGLTVTAFYHTAADGWVAFAEAAFASAPFAGGTVYVGVGTHTTGVTEATPTAFNLGTFKLRRKAGMSVILR